MKTTWNGMTTFAVCRGSASAKFFGTSSPMIIDSRVAMKTASTVAIDARHGTPASPMRREQRCEPAC